MMTKRVTNKCWIKKSKNAVAKSIFNSSNKYHQYK